MQCDGNAGKVISSVMVTLSGGYAYTCRQFPSLGGMQVGWRYLRLLINTCRSWCVSSSLELTVYRRILLRTSGVEPPPECGSSGRKSTASLSFMVTCKSANGEVKMLSKGCMCGMSLGSESGGVRSVENQSAEMHLRHKKEHKALAAPFAKTFQ